MARMLADQTTNPSSRENPSRTGQRSPKMRLASQITAASPISLAREQENGFSAACYMLSMHGPCCESHLTHVS